jgi:hypothetical protein
MRVTNPVHIEIICIRPKLMQGLCVQIDAGGIGPRRGCVCSVTEILEPLENKNAKDVPLHPRTGLGRREVIAPTHYVPRH